MSALTYEEGLHLLGLLNAPKVTLQDVKSMYRFRAFKCHPDMGGNAEEFRKLKDAYDTVLENTDRLTVDSDVEGIEYTADGYPISALGKGLGDKDIMGSMGCTNCQGKGYKIINVVDTFSGRTVYCPKCKGAGYTESRCTKCRGYGKIMGKICTNCYGKRVFRYTCTYCEGVGFKFDPSRREETVNRVAYYCSHCEGTGEIELLNPVIPRNVVTSRR